jgi:hypothetical protein
MNLTHKDFLKIGLYIGLMYELDNYFGLGINKGLCWGQKH